MDISQLHLRIFHSGHRHTLSISLLRGGVVVGRGRVGSWFSFFVTILLFCSQFRGKLSRTVSFISGLPWNSSLEVVKR